ncbi:penicillin acylase family protein [Pseudooceanicola lipolyticus]|uniref:Penicillin acylase family protein n=1 Tax=Pseudooceanicola lipolyticus TaxID=2029104 RepID=A0A2M8J1N9_9RHOB|nr:penicillin acylase family protein [Pseudooceanicola lipolyticus]PJE36699.1 penicillin acylase family protein [Pseudooceanicola lipolyticus]
MKDLALEDETLQVSGLQSDAEILIDTWGIPHLRARSTMDGFYLQGFNAARDRLWQMDLWRKRGLGRLAASFGPGFLEQDIAARAFLYRGDIEAEYRAYADDMEEICTAFVAGINAWIDLCAAEPERLPPEFDKTGSKPEKWQPEDVVRIRSHALTRNAISEVLRCVVLSEATAEADLLRKNLEPRVTPRNAGGIEFEDVPLEVLERFKLATAGVSFDPGRLNATRAEASKWRFVNSLAEVIEDAHWTGSNNWAVAGARTSTGRPVIAGDPHRMHAVPALRYLVHLRTPGFNVIGTGEPIAPGLCMGHNGTCAFTATIFGSDQEDIYQYETNPDNPLEYRFADAWEAMTVIPEEFEIRGHATETHDLLFTRHGPVLLAQPEKSRAYALRSVWWEPGTCAYLAGVSTMRSRDLDEFREGVARFGAPALNHVYADTSGNIAWLPYGFTPVRPEWDGLLPVPGNGEFEWDGMVPLDKMPSQVNPETRYVASANEANLPDDWQHEITQIGYEWLEKSRALRLHDVLGNSEDHSLDESCALQTDTFSWPGMRLQKLLRTAEIKSDPELAAIIKLLLDWDCMLSVGSTAGLIQEWWLHKRLKPALFSLFVPDPALHGLLFPGDVEGLLSALETPTAPFGPDPEAGRNSLLASTLRGTLYDLTEKFGPDTSTWAWGKLHHAYFEHPLSRDLGSNWIDLADVGPAPKPGSASTIMHAAYRESDFRVTTGASVRFVLDVGDWDKSRCITAPGQSGDPRSPFYDNLFEPWARGEYVPFLYSDAAIDAAVSQRITLIAVDTK